METHQPCRLAVGAEPGQGSRGARADLAVGKCLPAAWEVNEARGQVEWRKPQTGVGGSLGIGGGRLVS